MGPDVRKSGIEVLGDISWGTHSCQFYETKEDLLELLIPYFKAGLENNERCLWIVCDPITIDDAFTSLKESIPEFQSYLDKKSIEILYYQDWYFRNGNFNAKAIADDVKVRIKAALAAGYDGMRTNGNETWLTNVYWTHFMQYEKELNSLVQDLPIIVLCTYPLSHSDAGTLLDVANAHDRVISRRQGEWEVLENSLHTKAQIHVNELNATIRTANKKLVKLSPVFSYVLPFLAVAAASAILLLIRPLVAGTAPHASLFFCAVILSTWFGGSRPGFLAIILSLLAFDYFFLAPVHSFALETREIPRVILFILPSIFIVLLIATQKKMIGSISQAHKVLEWAVQRLDHVNAELRREIGKRKKSERHIFIEKELSQQIIDSIPGIFELYNKDLNFIRWNKQLEIISGYTSDEIRGMQIVDLFVGEQREKIYAIIKKIFEAGRYEGELDIITKDGKKLCLYCIKQLITYEGVPCIISTCIDITERRLIEEKLSESYRQIRALTEHLQNIREEERTRISREIHDELGQKLTVLKLDISWVIKKVDDANKPAKQKLNDLMQLLDATMQSVRRIAQELRPVVLDLGLPAAIDWYLKEFEKRSGVKTSFKDPGEIPELADPVKTGLFRIFQESLTNVARHSDARTLSVILSNSNGQLKLTMKDDGKGFEDQHITGTTLGILGMKERSEMMGGKFEICSSPGKGTQITVTIPLVKNAQP